MNFKKIHILLPISLIILSSCDKYNIEEYADTIKNTTNGNELIIPTKDGIIIEDGPVDLGLSVKWASHNLDKETSDHFSSSCHSYGSTFSWSTTKPTMPEIGGTKYDNATVLLGDGWRTPTADEFAELNSCRITRRIYKGTEGVVITGSTNNAIFLPIAGIDTYWTSTGSLQYYDIGGLVFFCLSGGICSDTDDYHYYFSRAVGGEPPFRYIRPVYSLD